MIWRRRGESWVEVDRAPRRFWWRCGLCVTERWRAVWGGWVVVVIEDRGGWRRGEGRVEDIGCLE